MIDRRTLLKSVAAAVGVASVPALAFSSRRLIRRITMFDPLDVLVYGHPYQLGGFRELSFFSDGSIEGVRVTNIYELITVPNSEPKLEPVVDTDIREVVFRDHWQDPLFRREAYEGAKRDLSHHPKVKFRVTRIVGIDHAVGSDKTVFSVWRVN